MKNQTIFFERPVPIACTATVAGPKESQGPLKNYFHTCLSDDLLGQKSHEHAEVLMHTSVLKQLLNRAGYTAKEIDCAFSGDLLDEIVSSNYAMRELDAPFCGLYNACATLGESYIIGASMLSAGFMNRVVCSVSSHFATAERQYRFPLELGSQRSPLAQWTVTGAAATLLDATSYSPIKITCGTIGKVTDYGVDDANDMGAAMMPAALSTIEAHLRDTGREVSYYDFIVTGDLGHSGSRLLQKEALKKGIDLTKNYSDCGILIYNREGQNVGQGGSGACCGGLVINSYIFRQMQYGRWKKVLFVPTGALMSKLSSLQGATIPAIAHAVAWEVNP